MPSWQPSLPSPELPVVETGFIYFLPGNVSFFTSRLRQAGTVAVKAQAFEQKVPRGGFP
jgi:hypothetical protein